MAKVTLSSLANLQNESSAVATINANNTLVTTAMENTLSRDGTSPNAMGASLDMNSNRLLNLPEPTVDTEPVRVIDMQEYVGNVIEGINGTDLLAAANVSVEPTGDLVATNVQDALETLFEASGPITVKFTATGTYTRTAGCTSVDVMVLGGGGGGGGVTGSTSNAAIGGPGAYGGRAIKHIDWANAVITGATKTNPCVLTITSNPYYNGDVITISEVEGMTELNGNSYTVANRTATTVELTSTDSSAYTTYTGGGIAVHVSTPVTVGDLGAGGLDTGATGSTGGTSSFGGYCSATGGAGGSGMTFGTTFTNAGAAAGGTGTGGDINIPGSGSGRNYRNSGTQLLAVAPGASGPYGAGGLSRTSTGAGLAASGYGAGGANALTLTTTAHAGGNGSPGLVLVQENFW